MAGMDDVLRRLAEQATGIPMGEGEYDDDEILDAEIVEDEPLTAERIPETPAGIAPITALHALAANPDQRGLDDVFEHRLGLLGRTDDAGAAPDTVEEGHPSHAASGAPAVAAMLRSPAILRQLIVLSEILDRPEHRW